MEPYRNSLSGRIVSGAVAFALIGGGLIPTLAIDPAIGLPIVLLISIVGGIVGLVLGVHAHTGPVALLAIVLPLALWPYVLGLLVVIERAPAFGLSFISVGASLVVLNFIAPLLRFRDEATPASPRVTRTA